MNSFADLVRDYIAVVPPTVAVVSTFVAVLIAQFFKNNLRAKIILVRRVGSQRPWGRLVYLWRYFCEMYNRLEIRKFLVLLAVPRGVRTSDLRFRKTEGLLSHADSAGINEPRIE